MRSFTIQISPATGEELLKTGVLPPRPLAVKSPECLRLATQVAAEIASQRPSSSLVATGLVLEIIGHLSRDVSERSNAKPVWLRAVVDRITSEFRNPASLSEYAASVSVHPVTLAKAFHKQEGLSIGAYIRRLRLQRAAELLLNSRADLTDIALESGFADHSHMSRWFRRSFGVSPSTYRRMRRH